MKETEKKHEGFATITNRERKVVFVFFERSVWQQQKGE